MKKNGALQIIRFFLFALMIPFIFMVTGCEEYVWLTDQCPYWDWDCDSISNAVETNDANAHHNFDPEVPNANPSIASGEPNNGSLEGGINLRDSEEGYKHFRGNDPVDYDDWGTLALINMIEGGGRFWNKYCPPRICILDMSKQEGGDWPPHSSHQNGRDVDVRYVRKDNDEAPLDIKINPQDYDDSATVKLMNCLFENGEPVLIIVSDVCGLGFTNIQVIYDSLGNHDNHFHLRIEDPDGTGN